MSKLIWEIVSPFYPPYILYIHTCCIDGLFILLKTKFSIFGAPISSNGYPRGQMSGRPKCAYGLTVLLFGAVYIKLWTSSSSLKPV